MFFISLYFFIEMVYRSENKDADCEKQTQSCHHYHCTDLACIYNMISHTTGVKEFS